jgi:hypothetical protein
MFARPGLPVGLPLGEGRPAKQEGQSQTMNTFLQFVVVNHNLTLQPGTKSFS